MAAYFFDSSALVKRYVREPGSTWVQTVLSSASEAHTYVVVIAAVEVVSAVSRTARGGALSLPEKERLLNQFRADYTTEYRRVEITNAVIQRAMDLAENYYLRAYDAVQLSAALEIQRLRLAANLPPLVFVSAGAALNTAAEAEGLVVENPNARE